jgi:hypothetical protein
MGWWLSIQVVVFWVVTPCSDEEGYQCFGRHFCFHFQGGIVHLQDENEGRWMLLRNVGTPSHVEKIRFLKQDSRGLFPNNFLENIRKANKNLRVIGIPSNIGTGNYTSRVFTGALQLHSYVASNVHECTMLSFTCTDWEKQREMSVGMVRILIETRYMSRMRLQYQSPRSSAI